MIDGPTVQPIYKNYISDEPYLGWPNLKISWKRTQMWIRWTYEYSTYADKKKKFKKLNFNTFNSTFCVINLIFCCGKLIHSRVGILGRHEPQPYRNEPPPCRIEPSWPPYSTRACVIQNTSLCQSERIFKTLDKVFKKRFLEFFSTQCQNSFTKYYNYLINVMNSAFNAT